MVESTKAKIQEIIREASTVWVASVDEEGYPAIKAMFATGKREGFGTYYLSTNTSSHRAQQYLHNPKAALYFCQPEQINGVMMRGKMEVLTDAPHRELLWNPGDEKYYPLGVTDPDYCVFRFTAQDGNCWMCSKGKTYFAVDEIEDKV